MGEYKQKTRAILLGVLLSAHVVLPGITAAAEGDFGGEVEVADNSGTATVEDLGPFGGDLWDVAVDSANSMVYTTAKDSPNGFYRSSNGGASWTGLTGVDFGGGIAVEVDATTGDVYAVFNGGTYKSEDQGVTFTKVTTDASVGFLVADGRVLVGSFGSGGEVSISEDSGATFQSHTFSSNSNEMIWDIDYSTDSGEYFIYSRDQSTNENHLYRSTDNGSSWNEITLPVALETVSESRFAVSPTNSLMMIVTGGNSTNAYMSINGGVAWMDSGVASSGVTIDHTGRVWIAEQYRDADASGWTPYDDDNTSSAIGGHNVTVDPSNSNVVYADGMPGLTKSEDGGATWTDINEGIKGVTISDISQATNKDVVWAAAYNGIAKTENFTAAQPTWQFPVLEEPGFSVWTDPTNPSVAVVGVSSGTRRTTDGGVTWSEYAGTDIIESHQVVDEIIADVNDSSVLYAAVSNNNPSSPKDGAVLISTNQGVSWSNLNLPNSGSAQTLTQAPNGDLYVGLGAESELEGETGIYKYSNSAWEKLAGAPAKDIVKLIADPDDSNIIYAVAGLLYNNGADADNGFYKSVDAGTTWTHITEGLDRIRNFTSLALQASTTPNTLYLGAENNFGQGVLFKSADGGSTWGVQYTGLQDETFYTLLFDGITVGSSRGLFDIKSKAAIGVNFAKKKFPHAQAIGLNVTLKDAVTNKKLKNQTVKLYTKKGSKLTLIKTLETNKKGKASVNLIFKRAKKYNVVAKWTPKQKNSEEYAVTTSDVVKVTAQ